VRFVDFVLIRKYMSDAEHDVVNIDALTHAGNA